MASGNPENPGFGQVTDPPSRLRSGRVIRQTVALGETKPLPKFQVSQISQSRDMASGKSRIWGVVRGAAAGGPRRRPRFFPQQAELFLYSCTNEETMITTPRYDSLFHSATAAGWLAVRVVGLNYTRLSCAIRLCNICESPEYCLSITPPQCKKVDKRTPDMWNQTTVLDEICRDNSTTTPSSSFKANCSPYLCLLWINFMCIFFVILRTKT
ncbi:cuticlin-like protein 19 [Ditylenchus destructor]|uniref:Cuticlin-like protein 19 n=1 Tax=Ditylenchus destructor TaxID=166010 RepID=A0AAD4NM91_9BILA|nr:cuticlin-like protein 19 [Ditylenchus destructor]